MVESSYSLFISFADADREWVDHFLIPEIGLPAEQVLTTHGFTPGAYAIEEFERAVEQSRYSLLVFSPAYLDDTTNRLGEKFASYISTEEQRQRLIPLVLRDCELPARIKARVQLNCTSESRWKSEVSRVRSLLNQPEPEDKPIACPYPGLMSYSQKEAGSFFGREEELGELAPRLWTENFLVILGSSGSGKSSFVFAGLIPELLRSQPGVWQVRSIRPGASPFAALHGAIQGLVDLGTGQSQIPAGQRLLLVIDPFEEIFTQAAGLEGDRTIAAINQLRQIPACLVILIIRSDFYGDLQGSALWPVPAHQRFDIAPLRAEAMRRSIRMPAETQGVFLEGSLVERLAGEAARELGALPLLQETLAQLWGSRMRFFLSLNAYERLGGANRSGLEEAISRKAEAVFARIDKNQQPIARRVLLRLVQFGEGRADTRRQQPFSKLTGNEREVEPARSVIRTLAESRLLTVSGEEDGEPKADLAHELLITGWQRLQGWINEYHQAELARRRLASRAEDWQRLGQRGGLLDAIELAAAQEWLASPAAQDVGVDAEITAVIGASQRALRASRRMRWLVPAAVVVGLLLLVSASWLVYSAGLRGQANALNPPQHIPGGWAIIGDLTNQVTSELPTFHAQLPDFDFEIHEVTNDQFCLCRRAFGCSGEPGYGDHAVCDSGYERLPVTKIRLIYAQQFCTWLGGRLPTELEWEWAARGPQGRRYPTGDTEPVSGEVNIRAVGVPPGAARPVDPSTKDKTPDYGLQDMAGNVSEWTISWYAPYDPTHFQPIFWPTPIPNTEDSVSVRGGNYFYQPMVARSSNRYNVDPTDQRDFLGFRCLMNLPVERFQQEVKIIP